MNVDTFDAQVAKLRDEGDSRSVTQIRKDLLQHENISYDGYMKRLRRKRTARKK